MRYKLVLSTTILFVMVAVSYLFCVEYMELYKYGALHYVNTGEAFTIMAEPLMYLRVLILQALWFFLLYTFMWLWFIKH